MTKEGVDLIVRHEGCPPRPYWPGGMSGITLGIGYDLAHHSPDDLEADWLEPGRIRGNPQAIGSLRACVGISGNAASARESAVKVLSVDATGAREVFMERSLPKYEQQTRQAFPGVDAMPDAVFSALVSLVFNRGPAMDGERRKEMREIRAAVNDLNIRRIADELRSMKRLWIGQGLPGLLARREDEALMVESVL